LKRIVLIGAAAAGVLSAGIPAAASAAATKSTHRNTSTHLRSEASTPATKATCKFVLTTVAPGGSSTVEPGTADGYQYGATKCHGLSSGVARDVFSTDTSGDLTGKIQQWFRGGTIYGTFDLTPQPASGPPTTTSFTAASYSGTVKYTGAQGLLKGTTATGTLSCSTTDSTHYSCTESLELTLPATTG
jgi:hypothetical protein